MQTKLIPSFLALCLFTSLAAQKVEPTYKHVSYGPHKDMVLNFWKIDSKKPSPLLVHIHGGGSRSGATQARPNIPCFDLHASDEQWCLHLLQNLG